MEKNLEKNIYIWNSITLLYTWNIVNQLYFNLKKESDVLGFSRETQPTGRVCVCVCVCVCVYDVYKCI